VARQSEDLLIREQFRVIVPDLPRLYITLVVVVGFVVILLLPVASPAILGTWATILTSVALSRGVYWWRIGKQLDSYSVAQMSAMLAQIDRIGGSLLVFFTCASLFVLQTPDLLLRTVTMLAIWAAAVGTSFSLAVLPRCSRNMMSGVSVCMCLVFLWSGGRALYIATSLFMAVSIGLIIQLDHNFRSFKGVVEAKHTIDALRREAVGLAMTDALTRLPNRRAFDERLALLAMQARPFSLAAIDLDGFKPVNDVFGHGIGDKVLVEVADRLRRLGGRVFAARCGGDEFILLIEGANFAEPLMQQVIDALSAPYWIEGVSIRIGASCGLAHWRAPGDECDILKRADTALYLAKSQHEREAGRSVVIKSAA